MVLIFRSGGHGKLHDLNVYIVRSAQAEEGWLAGDLTGSLETSPQDALQCNSVCVLSKRWGKYKLEP